MVAITVDAEPVKVCEGCNELVEEDALVASYECGDCGTEFTKDESADGDSNRCPDCNKFAAKTDEPKSECCSEAVRDGFKIEGNDGESLVLMDDEWVLEAAPAPSVN